MSLLARVHGVDEHELDDRPITVYPVEAVHTACESSTKGVFRVVEQTPDLTGLSLEYLHKCSQCGNTIHLPYPYPLLRYTIPAEKQQNQRQSRQRDYMWVWHLPDSIRKYGESIDACKKRIGKMLDKVR